MASLTRPMSRRLPLVKTSSSSDRCGRNAYYNGNKYDLDSFVIMPNHVHAIVQFRAGAALDTISQTWMRYTARQINFEANRSGRFWQPEPFDHIIRNEKQFRYLQTYIADNPRKANLSDGKFLYWQRDRK